MSKLIKDIKSPINKLNKKQKEILEKEFRLCYRNGCIDGFLNRGDEDKWIKENFKNVIKKKYMQKVMVEYEDIKTIKTNPIDNTIFIQEDKENWNKEELRKVMLAFHNSSYLDVDEWLNDNLNSVSYDK